MSFLDRMFGKVFVGRKGTRGNRRSPSRRQGRRLTIEQFSWHIVTRKLIQMYDRVRQGHHDQAAAGE